MICEPTTNIIETVDNLQPYNVSELKLVDINLSDDLSFEAFSKMQVTSSIILTIADNEYAIEAFKYHNFYYKLKSVASNIKEGKSSGKIEEENLQQVLEMMQKNCNKYRERFLLSCNDGYKIVNVEDINHIFTENKIVRLFLNNGISEVIPLPMDELEKQLNPNNFFRANRQYIVRIDSIQHVGNYFNSKLLVRLYNYPRVEIIVSKEKAPLLKEWIDR